MTDSVGCLHLDCAERVVPVVPYRSECLSCRGGVTEATGESGGVIGILPRAEGEDDLPFFPVFEIKGHLYRSAWIECGPDPAGKA